MSNINFHYASSDAIKDERGEITTIAKNADILSITAAKGSKRAAHYHKASSHLCLLTSGKMFYFERPTGSRLKPLRREINPGDYFFTGKMIDHLMFFKENSHFLCFSHGNRDKESYENDIVRLDYDLEDLYNNWQ